jgi:hypothetical protein
MSFWLIYTQKNHIRICPFGVIHGYYTGSMGWAGQSGLVPNCRVVVKIVTKKKFLAIV